MRSPQSETTVILGVCFEKWAVCGLFSVNGEAARPNRQIMGNEADKVGLYNRSVALGRDSWPINCRWVSRTRKQISRTTATPVVLTLWLSRMAAEGLSFRPARWRSLSRRHYLAPAEAPSCETWPGNNRRFTRAISH